MNIDKIRVILGVRSYDIVVGDGVLSRLPEYLTPLGLGKHAVVVTHASLDRMHGGLLRSVLLKAGYTVEIITVAQGEHSKSFSSAVRVVQRLARLDVGKEMFCLAFGGGVVGDLTGFVAAIYKRGIPYIQVPTSLLAQVDSAIGGKTGIDLTFGKNLVGAMYQPKLVLSDTSLLHTLSQRQMRNGLAEIIKYGVIADAQLFSNVQSHLAQFFHHDPVVLRQLIKASATIKARVVSADETETKGLRLILNFGHTFGHAVEAAGGFAHYQHGEAVALGMRMACRLSVLLGCLKASQEKDVNALLSAAGLPVTVKGVPLPVIAKHLQYDKKIRAGKNRFIIARSIGKVFVKEGIDPALIHQAMHAYVGKPGSR